MLGLCINNSLTTNDKRKLRAYKSSYTFNAQDDGDEMFFVIVKFLQPDTCARLSDIKFKLENMKMFHLKNYIPKSNL